MRKKIVGAMFVALVAVLGISMATVAPNVIAEEKEEEVQEYRTSLTISPASRTVELRASLVDEGILSVSNDGDSTIAVEVYAAPYSYVYSEEDDEYKLGYSHENSFTQLSRWITVRNKDNIYETKATFNIKPKETEQIAYRITVPEDIPVGGQYAVLFAQVKSGDETVGAIKADPSLGMIIYGRSNNGEVTTNAEIREMDMGKGVKNENSNEEDAQKTIFYGSAKVKNTGNVDFFAQGILEVSPIIGFSSYKTPEEQSYISIIPETELTVSDQWEDLPDFGIYKATWTVIAGDEVQTIEQVLFLFPPFVIIIALLVLTLVIIGVIMDVKRRKTKKSRLTI